MRNGAVRDAVAGCARAAGSARRRQRPQPWFRSALPGSRPSSRRRRAYPRRQYAPARAKIDAVLATDARIRSAIPQGVVQTDEDETARRSPRSSAHRRLPGAAEPYKTCRDLGAAGEYDGRARRSSGARVAADYAIAPENLGDIYARLASARVRTGFAARQDEQIAQTNSRWSGAVAVAPSSTRPSRPCRTGSGAESQEVTAAPSATARPISTLAKELPCSAATVHARRRCRLGVASIAAMPPIPRSSSTPVLARSGSSSIPTRRAEDGREFPRVRAANSTTARSSIG